LLIPGQLWPFVGRVDPDELGAVPGKLGVPDSPELPVDAEFEEPEVEEPEVEEPEVEEPEVDVPDEPEDVEPELVATKFWVLDVEELAA
jgi:hypothetical protein